MGERVFSCGSEYLDWQDRNCHRCVKDYVPETEAAPCELENAIAGAAVGDGTIPDELAERLKVGIYGPARECPEREAKS